jgi:UDP-galactopyranose mutase
MKPFYLTIDNSLDIAVIPDSDAHVDGHPVLTYSYSIYKNVKNVPVAVNEKENTLHLEEHNDPNYMGVIIFEEPDKVFTYEAGVLQLSSNEVEEIIEKITHYRDTPSMWII